jgi:hypothetical protein
VLLLIGLTPTKLSLEGKSAMPTKAMRSPRSPAERMRLYRRRRRHGMLSVRVRLGAMDIASLVRRGYLEPEVSEDLAAIEEAADAFISDALFEG